MNRQKLLQSVPARILAFLWLLVFPLAFILVPLFQAYQGEREFDLFPLWAFGVWILGPWVVMIVMKYADGNNEPHKDN